MSQASMKLNQANMKTSQASKLVKLSMLHIQASMKPTIGRNSLLSNSRDITISVCKSQNMNIASFCVVDLYLMKM